MDRTLMVPEATCLWQPSDEQIQSAQITTFMSEVNEANGLSLKTYQDLYEWSVKETALFWESVAQFCGMQFDTPYSSVVDDPVKLPGAKWFENGTLNVASHYLRFRDDRVALKYCNEVEGLSELSYKALYQHVATFAKRLKESGVSPGDRVAAITTNCPEAIIGFLAAASLGAVWSSCSPDFGEKGILDRFQQIEPTILLSVTGYHYHGKAFPLAEKVASIVSSLPTVEKLYEIPTQGFSFDTPVFDKVERLSVTDTPDTSVTLTCESLPFSHPIYIVYSSGTTGKPKAIVHSAGGILLQHLKEHVLHGDLRREDTLFYFTTCGWMMWNWLVSGLVVGATLVLYDGSPMFPKLDSCWQLIDEAQITVFGTSAKFVATSIEKGLTPKDNCDFGTLRSVLTTGSPLIEPYFDFLYDSVKKDMQVASISGGTDIVSCFTLGCSILPVYRGYLQCRGLGMAVEAWDDDKRSVVNETGELVCTKAAPSMPLYFWNDPEGSRYHDSYFDQYPNVWYHGDYMYLHESGACKMLGRSDATLNPGGVRIGTAEIYRVVEAIDGIQDSLVVGKKVSGDEVIMLYVQLDEGVELDRTLKSKIMNTLKTKCSPRHVPRRINAVPEIPYTLNGKKVEVAVKKILEGKPITNTTSLKNPACLDAFKESLK